MFLPCIKVVKKKTMREWFLARYLYADSTIFLLKTLKKNYYFTALARIKT